MLNKKLLIFGTVFLFLISFASADVLDINDSLIAYWKGNGTLLDEQSNYSLEPAAGIEYTDGNFGQAIRVNNNQWYFNDSFSTVSCMDDTFTIDAYVNMSDCANFAGSNYFFGTWGDNSNWWWLRCSETGDILDLLVRIATVTEVRIQTGPSLDDGKMHHIMVKQNATTISLHLDGTQLGTDNAVNFNGLHNIFDIGKYRASDGEGLFGIDDIAFWCIPRDDGYITARNISGGAELTVPTPPPTDSCNPDSPLSADHTFDCADNCLQSTPLDAGGNDLYFIGTDQTTDTFTLTSFFTNFKDMLVIHCYITGIGASFFT